MSWKERWIGTVAVHLYEHDCAIDIPKQLLAQGYEANLVDEDLYHWHVKVFDFFHNSRLADDLEKIKNAYGIVRELLA